MNIANNQPLFNYETFGLGEDGQVADQAKFCVGLQELIDRPLEAIHSPELVERVFKTISDENLANWPGAKKVKELVGRVFEEWVKVSLGDSVRHIPRQRMKSDCGPKFMQQYEHRLVDTRSHELHLALPGNASSEDYPAKLTESFLSQLQTGVVSEDAFDENILNLIDLALQHFQEALVKECVDFLVENLDNDNLDTLLTFTIDRNLPQLKLTCLSFMRENQADIPVELQIKYRNQFDLLKSLRVEEIELRSSPSGHTELYIEPFNNETLHLLKRITDEIPIHSLVMSNPNTFNSLSFLRLASPHFQELQELVVYNTEPTDQEIPTLKELFPKLKAFGNDAPFLKTFEEVETYLHSFAKPGGSEPESETLALCSLNLDSLGTLDDGQMDKLAEFLEDVSHLSICSSNITSLVAPKAMTIYCGGCTALETLTVPNARTIDCWGCIALTTLDAPNATKIKCNMCKALTTIDAPIAMQLNCLYCEGLTTLNTPNAATIDCFGFEALTTLNANNATTIACHDCTALETLVAPNATSISCGDCTALTTLDAPNATYMDCRGCKALTTLEAPNARTIHCSGCEALTTLTANNAVLITCYGCKALITPNAPDTAYINCDEFTVATTPTPPEAKLTGESRIQVWARWFQNQICTFWNAVLALLVWLPNRLQKYVNALSGK